MRRCSGAPSPPEIDAAPQLAVIALTDAALETLVAALLAAHHELYDPERPYWLGRPAPSSNRARHVLTHVRRLAAAIERYRRALEREVIPKALPSHRIMKF